MRPLKKHIMEESIMYCVNCGAKIPEGAAFCESCGAPVQNRPAQSMGGFHQEKKQKSGAMILVRLLVCILGGFLLAALLSGIPDALQGRGGGVTVMPLMVIMIAVHCILLLVITWKPFSRKLGTGFGAVAAMGVSLGVSLCLVVCIFSIGQNPQLLIPATLLYAGVLYGFGIRFEKKD